MRNYTPKTFNIKEHRPNVILIGNGFVRTPDSLDWKQTLEKLASDNNTNICIPQDMPYSLQAMLTFNERYESEKNKAYFSTFSEKDYPYSKKEIPLLKKLLNVDFDAFLTTNYTYELEDAIRPGFHKLDKDIKRDIAYCSLKPREKYHIYTLNRLNGKNIWHIHGEQRRSSSIVLTHSEYIKAISKMIEHINSNSYYDKDKQPLDVITFSSWIDYFLLGNLFILGQGFNYSEVDLWWLLNKRLRLGVNKNDTPPKTYFYEPFIKNKNHESTHNSVFQVLESLNITVNDFNFEIPCPDQNNKELVYSKFQEFYNMAVDDILNKSEMNH